MLCSAVVPWRSCTARAELYRAYTWGDHRRDDRRNSHPVYTLQAIVAATNNCLIDRRDSRCDERSNWLPRRSPRVHALLLIQFRPNSQHFTITINQPRAVFQCCLTSSVSQNEINLVFHSVTCCCYFYIFEFILSLKMRMQRIRDF